MKHLLIYGSPAHTPTMLEEARLTALLCFRMFVSNWGVVTGDGHGIEAEVARTCQAWDIPLLVVGTGVRPTNGVSMKLYQHLFTASGKLVRNHYLVDQAQRIIAITNTDQRYRDTALLDLLEYAKHLGKEVEIRGLVARRCTAHRAPNPEELWQLRVKENRTRGY